MEQARQLIMNKRISEQVMLNHRFVMGAGQPALVIFNSLGTGVDKMDDLA